MREGGREEGSERGREGQKGGREEIFCKDCLEW